MAVSLGTPVRQGNGEPPDVVLRAWERSFFTFRSESNGPCLSGTFRTGFQVVPLRNAQQPRIHRPFGECR